MIETIKRVICDTDDCIVAEVIHSQLSLEETLQAMGWERCTVEGWYNHFCPTCKAKRIEEQQKKPNYDDIVVNVPFSRIVENSCNILRVVKSLLEEPIQSLNNQYPDIWFVDNVFKGHLEHRIVIDQPKYKSVIVQSVVNLECPSFSEATENLDCFMECTKILAENRYTVKTDLGAWYTVTEKLRQHLYERAGDIRNIFGMNYKNLQKEG
jgi:hypothetical protein